MARAPRPPRIHGCNLLHEADGKTRIWSFIGADARPAGDLSLAADKPVPPAVGAKKWGQLFRRRVDIAWTGDLPVFLQLVRLPTDDPAEVPAMLELQLEKLSPLPPSQVAWSYEILPDRPAGALSVLVLVAEREAIDNLLLSLEKRGFQADRVEPPLLQTVVGTSFAADGAYLFPFTNSTSRGCLIGWAAGGSLRSLSLVNLAADDRWVRQLVEELNRLAWAAEMDGWLPAGLKVHLVAEDATLDVWRGPLEQALGVPLTPVARPGDAAVAAEIARRTVAGEPRANLLPAEQAVRYRQQFTDRLWMGGLGAILAIYVVGLLIYFAAVEVQKYRQGEAADRFAEVTGAYTNTLRVKAQTQVLQETMNLRYAAIDSWLAAVEVMPEELTLEKFAFSGGQSVSLSGTAPSDQDGRITEYWQALRRKVVGNTNLFSEVQLRPTVVRSIQGARVTEWSFVCTLRRSEL